MDTNSSGCHNFVTETAIESTLIPLANAGLLLERNSGMTHFSIPPNAAVI
jgi:hypothetical protein